MLGEYEVGDDVLFYLGGALNRKLPPIDGVVVNVLKSVVHVQIGFDVLSFTKNSGYQWGCDNDYFPPKIVRIKDVV